MSWPFRTYWRGGRRLGFTRRYLWWLTQRHKHI